MYFYVDLLRNLVMSLGDELVYICKLLILNKVTRVKLGTDDDKDNGGAQTTTMNKQDITNEEVRHDKSRQEIVHNVGWESPHSPPNRT